MKKFDLCSIDNQTYVILNLIKEINAVEGKNQIIGSLGSCIDATLCKPMFRKCTVYGEKELGAKMENGTYSGILGLLQKKKIDLYLKSESQFIDEPSIKQTNPIKTEKILAGQMIFDKESVSYFDLINNFYLGTDLFLSFCLCIILGSFFLFFLISLKKRKDKFKNLKFDLLLNIFLTNEPRLSVIGLFLSFSSLFFWFLCLFLTSEKDLLNTNKVGCFVHEETEHKIAMNLPRSSLLSRIFYEKTIFRKDQVLERSVFGERCFIKYREKIPPISIMRSDLFVIGSETAGHLLYLLSARSGLNIQAWKYGTNTPIYEFNDVLLFNLRNQLNIKFISILNDHVELGLNVNMFRCFERNTKIVSLRTVQEFNSLDDYISEYSKFSNLDVSNFRTIFLAYFGICLTVFIVSLLVSNARKIPRPIISIKFYRSKN